MPDTVIATATCRGSAGRVSGNFSTKNYPPGTRAFIWKVTQNGTENDDILFNVKDDIKLGADDYYFKDVKNGEVTPVFDDRAIFIADPSGSNAHDFTVELIATASSVAVSKRQFKPATTPRAPHGRDSH